MEHKVTGCVDCPMLDDGSNYEYEAICKHPLAPHQFYEPDSNDNPDEIPRIDVDEDWNRKPTHIPETPDWCPLNKEPITIIKE